MTTTSVKITESGPIFDGRIHQAVDGFLEDAREEVGQQGVNDVQARLGMVLKNPTGRYEGAITTDRQMNDVEVTDAGIVYGPWLEGTSSRNTRSQFKGYATFRKTTQDLQGKTDDIARGVLRRWLSRMQ